MFQFDLQLFGGKGGSTTTVTERPLTEDEIRLIKAQADVAEAFQPNILGLNSYAMNLLKDSIGANQLDFYGMNDNAQKQISDNIAKYGGLADSNNTVTDIADDKLNWLSGVQEFLATSDADKVNDLAQKYERATDNVNDALSGYIDQNATASQAINNVLNRYVNKNDVAVNAANNALGNYIGQNTNAIKSTNSDLSRYINQNDLSYDDVARTLSGLQNGELPTAYQQNMTEAIRAALDATIGDNLNGLANRGVLNSSITDSALNSIESNAAQAVAQNYINNLNTVGNFAQQRFGDNAQTTAANASLTNQQLQNITNENQKNAGLVQQQYQNTVNNSNTNANLAQQGYQNTINSNNTNANLAQQQLGNTAQANANAQNALDYNYQRVASAADNYANLTQQRAQNYYNTNSANAGLYQGAINNATAPITTAAGAQEAAQAPARNLWDASIGLNSSNNGTLAAIAGAQPKSTTTTTENGGGFWGGLLGGAATVFCFPKGTMVHMANGEKKDIADIVVGDEVIDKDGNTAKVIKLLPEHTNDVYELRTIKGAVTRTTTTQPFFLENGSQKELRYLSPYDILLNMGEIANIKYKGKERVYDFETDGENNYIVDGGFVAQGGGIDWWKG